MSGPVVADVGNTRIKWGLCSSEQVWSMVSLPPDAGAWDKQWHDWKLERFQEWIVAGVHPKRRDALIDWLKPRCDAVHLLNSSKQLPVKVELEHPDKVGIDRLLNGVAANRRRQPNVAAILIGAGTAVTVDYLDGDGVFKGGTIFPGFGLMAQALHEHTACCPSSDDDTMLLPGTSAATIQAGVLCGRRRHRADHRGISASLSVVQGIPDRRRRSLHSRYGIMSQWPEMLEGILHHKSAG